MEQQQQQQEQQESDLMVVVQNMPKVPTPDYYYDKLVRGCTISATLMLGSVYHYCRDCSYGCDKHFAESVVFARDMIAYRNIDKHLIPDLTNIVMDYLVERCFNYSEFKCVDVAVSECHICKHQFCRDCTHRYAYSVGNSASFVSSAVTNYSIDQKFRGSEGRPFLDTLCDVCFYRNAFLRDLRRYQKSRCDREENIEPSLILYTYSY